MILGLTALGEGSMPPRTRFHMSLAHILGGVVGGMVSSGLLWFATSPIRTLLPHAAGALLVSGAALAALAIDTGVWKLPKRGAQVNPAWLPRYGPWRSYAAYGFLFGTAFATVRTYAIVYVALPAAAVLATLPIALAAGALFGLGRTSPIGPGSFRATRVSRLLYRSSGARRTWRAASAVLAIALLAIALASVAI